MPKIIEVACAVPKNEITQDKIKLFAKEMYGGKIAIDHLLPVFENAQIDKRYFAADLSWVSHDHDFGETNDLYIKTALELSEEAVLKLCKSCEIKSTDFDIIYFISTTGLSTPSIDARLMNRILFNPHIKRVPIWGLGCAGGAAAIARAAEYLQAFPEHRALIIAVELCGLSFRREATKSNIVSTAIFADGAAACLMIGDRVELESKKPRPTPQVVGSLSTLFPDTLDVMNWKITRDGFQVGLSRDIPSITHSLVLANINKLLDRYKVNLSNLRHFVMHPGGAKVLHAYADALKLEKEQLHFSADILREYGNMSSATVFFVLDRVLNSSLNQPGYGLVSALGPGFSSELTLLKWN